MFFYLLSNPMTMLIAAAAVPAVLLLVYVYKIDRLEHEPPGLIIGLVLLGMLATIIALVLETAGVRFISAYSGDAFAYRLLFYYIVVACSEEGAKYLLMRFKTWNSSAFNCQFDGVVYAVSVSLGFALLENIMYVLQYGMATAVVRAFTAVPGHACFGVFMGAWYGHAKRFSSYGRRGAATLCRVMAFVLPMFVHGSYDYIATMGNNDLTLLFLVFVIVLFVIAFFMVRKLSKTDRYI